MSPRVHPDTRVTVPPSVYSRTLGTETVLLDFGRGEYFALDEVGAEIFRLVETGATVGDIAAAVATRFDVPQETALRDAIEFVTQMADEGLLTVLA